MDETKNSEVKIELKEGTEEIVVRQGEAEQLRDPKILDIRGVLNAPRMYWEKRRSLHEVKQCHVIYDKENAAIRLNLDEKNYFGGYIQGFLKVSSELSDLGINNNNTYTTKELMQLLRMRRYLFADAEMAQKIVSNLSKFKASVKMEIEQSDNNRGDLTSKLEKKVESEIPLGFELKMVVFVGLPAQKFKVEIFFNVYEAQATLWLESPQLRELIKKLSEQEVDKELKAFEDLVSIECTL